MKTNETETRSSWTPRVGIHHYHYRVGYYPRGFGRWAFGLSCSPAPEAVFWFTGSFSEAKKAAQKHFAGQSEIHVLS